MKDLLDNYKRQSYELQVALLDELMHRLEARGFVFKPSVNHQHINPLRRFDGDLARYYSIYLDREPMYATYKGHEVSIYVVLPDIVRFDFSVMQALKPSYARRLERWHPEAWKAGRISKYQSVSTCVKDSSLDKLIKRFEQKVKSHAHFTALQKAEAALGVVDTTGRYY